MLITNLYRSRYLPRAQFIRDHLNANHPVILQGLLRDWPAMHRWNAAYLRDQCGGQTIEVMGGRNADPQYEINCERHRQSMAMAHYIDRVFSDQSNDVYMTANNGFLNTPAGQRLLPDIPPFPEYLHPETAGRTFLWFGPAGTVTPLHHDTTDILFAQVIGAKRIRLIDPAQKPFLYNSRGVFSEVDYDNPDLMRHPLFASVTTVDVIINAGEVLFIPVGWWHHVTALSASASVSFTNIIRG